MEFQSSPSFIIQTLLPTLFLREGKGRRRAEDGTQVKLSNPGLYPLLRYLAPQTLSESHLFSYYFLKWLEHWIKSLTFLFYIYESHFLCSSGVTCIWTSHWSDQECLQSQSNCGTTRPQHAEAWLPPPSLTSEWSQEQQKYYLLQSRLLAVYCSFFLVFPFCTLYSSPFPSPTFAILVLDQMMMTTGVAVGALAGEPSLKAAVGGGRLLHLLWRAVQGLLNSMPSWDGGRFWHTILLILFCIYDFKSWHEHFMTLSRDHISQKYRCTCSEFLWGLHVWLWLQTEAVCSL